VLLLNCGRHIAIKHSNSINNLLGYFDLVFGLEKQNMRKKRKIICFCKKCGAPATMLTTAPVGKVSLKDREFICNECFYKRKKT